MKSLATYSIKGGVGKTTSAVNLAFEAARAGARVLVWDLDPQAAASYCLRAKPKLKGGAGKLIGNKDDLERHIRPTEFGAINVIAADFSLRNLDVVLDDVKKPIQRLARLLAPIADRYDVALLDCPPSISLASESVFGAVDALLVPTIPAPLSARTLTQLTQFLASWPDPPLVLPYVSMLDRRRSLQVEIARDLHRNWANMLDTDIPSAAIIERMSQDRAPIGAIAPKSAATRSYRSLWAEISRRLWA